MISNYCRPSSRPPEAMIDLADEAARACGKVSFAEQADNHESPRSCGVHLETIFGVTKPSNDQEANANASDDPAMEDTSEDTTAEEETPAEVAMLLTAVAGIASKEIQMDPPIMSALADAFPRFPDLSSALSLSDESPEDEHMELYETVGLRPNKRDSPLMHFDHREKKMRAVSVDFPELRAAVAAQHPQLLQARMQEPQEPLTSPAATPALMQWRDLRGQSTSPPHAHNAGIFSTPPPSPMMSGRRHGSLMAPNSEYRRSHSAKSPHQHGGNSRPRSVSMAEAVIRQVPLLDLAAPKGGGVSDKPKKLILRKKFSWKNYPELEEFLIANREEYLRHSTLNYTMQQKKYNNCLTERMIKLAGEHGYVFDETEFSFVTVRDRIRCYYKSYVQSMKKRGVVIGYAARKAGLVTEEELEQSAHTSGKIYVPKN